MHAGGVDLYVGVDFGMTCTGVSYALRGMKLPNMIMEWPDNLENDVKVPSTLLYQTDKKTVESWGFACQYNKDSIDWFKRHLDERALRKMLQAFQVDPPYKTVEEVRAIYRHYMAELYKHISETLQPKLQNADWSDKRVEFLFSLPATFNATDTSDALEKELRLAGFGTGGKHHKVSMDLTEPQAAAVYTAFNTDTQLFQGNVILTCDAGGGTTDLAILEQRGDENYADLHELVPVSGVNVGSTTVDDAFRALAGKRLKLARKSGMKFKKDVEDTMMRSQQFQAWKTKFGPKLKESHFKVLPVDIPLARKDVVSDKEAGIEDGKLMLSHDDMRSFFDPSIDKIAGTIRDLMDTLQAYDPKKRINYLVLSGGLGSSAYVKTRLHKAFRDEHGHPSAPDLKILVSLEPQVAVAKGLVHNILHKKTTGNSALKAIQARASYGIVCMTEYDKKRHQNIRSIKTIDGRRWAQDTVQWIIKKGDMIDMDKGGELYELHRDFPRSAEKKWKSQLVICHNEADQLPISSLDEDVFHLCTVITDLSSVKLSECEEKKRKKNLFDLKPKENYFQIRYQVKFILAPAQIKFELWLKGKQYAEPNTTRFNVQWEEGHRTAARPKGIHYSSAERWTGSLES